MKLIKLSCALMAVMIFSGCSTGVPVTQIQRSEPIDFMIPLEPYEEAASVAEIPVVYVGNMETAGICRGRLMGLQG